MKKWGNLKMGSEERIDARATATIRKRYERMSPTYDRMGAGSESRSTAWRKELWAQVKGPVVLEVGVGTGRNMEYYPKGLSITAIDLTPGMLAQARKKAASLYKNVSLQLGDVQALGFPDNSFDAAVATFVFCSVPNPVAGFRELKRVVKPAGQVLLLEHMRSTNPLLGLLMDMLNPLSLWLWGDNINRRTVESIGKAGLAIESITRRGMGGIFAQILIKVEK